mgnify:FL=1
MTAVAVRIYDAKDSDRQRWDDFVEQHPEASFFHRYGWAVVLRAAFGHRPHYLLAERDGEIVGLLPLGEIRSLLFGHSLISSPFCVYGGPLASDEHVSAALIDAASVRARELNVDYLELRGTRRSRPDWPCKDDLYVTFRKPIAANDDDNLKAIPRKQRAMVRAGIDAKLTVTIDPGPDRLWPLYAESVRNLGTPVFPSRYFTLLQREFGADCEVTTVEHDAQPLASVMSFYHRGTVLPYYGRGSSLARQYKANDFMYWSVMRRAVERGITVFDYGRSKLGTGSFSFKKHWGFEPEPLYHEYDLVKAKEMPNVSPTNPKYQMFIAAWRKLPLPVSNTVGPWLARSLG